MDEGDLLVLCRRNLTRAVVALCRENPGMDVLHDDGAALHWAVRHGNGVVLTALLDHYAARRMGRHAPDSPGFRRARARLVAAVGAALRHSAPAPSIVDLLDEWGLVAWAGGR